jgi:outer membrane protein TolC
MAVMELGTAQAAWAAPQPERGLVLTELARLLGVADSPLELTAPSPPADALPPLADALAAAAARSDVRALEAERQASLKEAHLADASIFPTPRVKGSYQYWNSEHSVMTWLEVPIPVFDRGQGESARSRARAGGLALEKTLAERHAVSEVETLWRLASDLGDRRRNQVEDADASTLLQDVEHHYAQRAVDLNTVLTVQRQFAQRRQARLQLETQEAVVRFLLDAAMGWPANR